MPARISTPRPIPTLARQGRNRRRRALSTLAAVGALGLGLVAVGLGATAGADETPAATATKAVPQAARVTRKRTLPYPLGHVWSTAVRYLRIDRGFTILDRDAETGYVVFSFKTVGARTGKGALEMFETVDAAGRPSVSVQISTEAGPAHLPFTLLEGLAKKIREERGQPVTPPKPTEPPAKPDAPNPDDHSPPQVPPALDPSDLVIN